MKPNTVMMGFYDNLLPEDLLKNRPLGKKRKILQYGISNPLAGSASNSISMSLFEGTFFLFMKIKLSNLALTS